MKGDEIMPLNLLKIPVRPGTHRRMDDHVEWIFPVAIRHTSEDAS